MASEAGRGAQVRLDGEARQLARGGVAARLAENLEAKRVLEAAGAVADGSRPDGSTATGLAAEDEVLVPGGANLSAGGTITGDFVVQKASPGIALAKTGAGQNMLLGGYSSGLLRWQVSLGDATAEAGSNAGSDFGVYRFSDAGAFIDAPLLLSRATGALQIKVPGSFADDAAAASGGVPVGGVYRNGSALMIRAS